jgi:uncharacterized membrane protein
VTAEPTEPPPPPPGRDSGPVAEQPEGAARQPEPTVPPPPASSASTTAAVQPSEDRRGIPAGSASDLWVFSLDSFVRAQEAMLAVSRLVKRGHLDVEDAAIVTVRGGRVRLTQTRDINPSQGALSGAWLGTLAGLLAGIPLVGAALGAAAGGIYARLRDFGIDDAAMKEFGADLEEGRAGLFLLVRDCHRMRALYEVSRFPARLERSSADPALVEQVRERLSVDPWDG